MNENLEPYAERLRELPFVRDVRLLPRPNRADGLPVDATLVLTAPDGDHELVAETKRTHLTYGMADHWIDRQARLRGQQLQPILFAPYVPRKIGEHLAAHGANYIDLEGNCHVRLGDRYIAAMEGRLPRRKELEGRGLRAAGYQVLFAVLAKPEILDEGIVRIGDHAGVGKTTVAETLAKLEREGLLTNFRNRRRLVKPGVVLDRWLVGYANVVRPRLLIGRYRTQDNDPPDLERRIEQALENDADWAWGGGVAAMRLIRHYRGETTTIHVAGPALDLPRRLRALRHAEGPLVLLRAPGRLAFDGVLPRTVHPLLIYTELVTAGDERGRETALEIRHRYLGGLA